MVIQNKALLQGRAAGQVEVNVSLQLFAGGDSFGSQPVALSALIVESESAPDALSVVFAALQYPDLPHSGCGQHNGRCVVPRPRVAGLAVGPEVG